MHIRDMNSSGCFVASTEQRFASSLFIQDSFVFASPLAHKKKTKKQLALQKLFSSFPPTLRTKGVRQPLPSLLIQRIIISMTASLFSFLLFGPFMSRGSSMASFITLSDRHTSHSVVLTRAGKRRGLSDLEVASDRLGTVGWLSRRWLLPSRDESVRRNEREGERRIKLGLITSCIFKQAHSPCGGESSIFGETHEKEGDTSRQREREGVG